MRFLFLVLFIFSLCNPAYAEIILKGNKRVEKETIFASLVSRTSADYDGEVISQSIKNLYDTGFFTNVNIYHQGKDVIVEIEENPVINKIAFEGNKRIEDDKLLPELIIRQRTIFNKMRLQDDVQRIVDIYRQSGRYAVKVVPKIIQLEQNRVNVIFEVDEGDKAEVRKILFYGNEKFGDGRLRDVLTTKETRWFRFFSSTDKYDADRINYDAELLRKFYMSRGYANVVIRQPTIQLSPDKKNFIISFYIDEGQKYDFGKIDVKVNIAELSDEQLKNTIISKSSDVFDNDEIEKTVDKMTDKLGDMGYAFVNIDPEINLNHDKKIADVTFVVNETKKYYINKINIIGNTKTEDKVIRREFKIAEGDPYNQSKLTRSEQNVNSLDFFEKVEVTPAKTEEEDKLDVNVKVEEKSTGSIKFAAGLSSSSGAIGKVMFAEHNLMGKGYDFAAEVGKSQRDFDVDVSITDPYFMDSDISLGVDITHLTVQKRGLQMYKSALNQFRPRIGYNLTEDLTHSIYYLIKRDNISQIDPRAGRYITEQQGRSITSLIGHSFLFDKTDNRLKPENGYLFKINQEVAGLGGDKKFIRHEVKFAFYKPLFTEEFIFSSVNNAGHIKGISGNQVNIGDRFILGGDRIRGFKDYGIGPRDKTTLESIGGNIYYASQNQVAFPIGFPKELGVKGIGFFDFGSLHDVDVRQAIDKDNFYNSAKIRAATGAGIMWDSPFGSVGVTYGIPVAKESHDRRRSFRFMVMTPF
jgi:outer membrane protein insertion porin family